MDENILKNHFEEQGLVSLEDIDKLVKPLTKIKNVSFDEDGKFIDNTLIDFLKE
jgi:hypothetical protein